MAIARASTMSGNRLRPSFPSPSSDTTFSTTIVDSQSHCLPRSSSRISAIPRQKASLHLDAIECSDALQLNLSPIRLETADVTKVPSHTEHSLSTQLSGSKLDTTYSDLVAANLVCKEAILGRCRKRLLEDLDDTFGESKLSQPQVETPLATPRLRATLRPSRTPRSTFPVEAQPTPAAVNFMPSPVMQSAGRKPTRICSRVASIRRCESSVVGNMVTGAGTYTRQRSRPITKVTGPLWANYRDDTTLDITTTDSQTWNAKRRQISLDADEVLESTRISQLAASTPLSPLTTGLTPEKLEDTPNMWQAADHIPMLELSERKSPWKQGTQQSKLYHAYKGQLQLSVYMNSGLLTVHIIRADSLAASCQSTINSYVKLGIVPDELQKSRSKTETICNSNNPVYDEKFSFELLPEDFNKRLLVSVWSREQQTGCCELLGCMSFGLRGIRSKQRISQSWYYLLSESIGRSRHLTSAVGITPVSEPGGAPSRLAHLQDVEPFALALRKGRTDYGFSVTGSNPAQVSRVESGGPADQSGLQPGDWIIRINGENVSTATAECVGRIIRHYSRCIILEICRQKCADPSNPSTPCQRLQPRTPWTPACGILDSNSSSSSSDESDSSIELTRVKYVKPMEWRLTQNVKENVCTPRGLPGTGGRKRKRSLKRKRLLKFSDYLSFR